MVGPGHTPDPAFQAARTRRFLQTRKWLWSMARYAGLSGFSIAGANLSVSVHISTRIKSDGHYRR